MSSCSACSASGGGISGSSSACASRVLCAAAAPAPGAGAPARRGTEEAADGHDGEPDEAAAAAAALFSSSSFSVRCFKADFKFNAAHFVAYRGFRERLHGHNYRVGVEMWARRGGGGGGGGGGSGGGGGGGGVLARDGYVVDFGDVKRVVRAECKRLNERFLCPCRSDVLRISFPGGGSQLRIDCEDGSVFSFPRADCAELPIAHSSVEELAAMLSDRLVAAMRDELVQRDIQRVEVTVAEHPGQSACYSVER
jgi:6-pyruvoyl-tetrahydropterin synthase